MAKAKAPKTTEAVEEKAPKFTARTVRCDGFTALNVRPKPEFGGKPVRTLANGAKVKAAPAVDGWCELEDGGFVKAEYLG